MEGRLCAFGKMPSAGDFFRIGTPADFIAAWDPWLQSALLEAQACLGSDWNSHYMSAPIWRFALASGLAGSRPVMGVLMPSVDRVGRRFPLTLLSPLETGDPLAGHFASDAFYERLEDIALAALEDDMTRERLHAALADVPPPAAAKARQGCGTVTAADIPGLGAALCADRVASQTRRPSLWTARFDGAAHLMICEGLPDSRQATGLFDLQSAVWKERGA